ncbi:hypothetical protein [Bradyrhizobium sp.]|nr:hypothetical protein [Bradyrhizobium sp.]
MRLQQPTKFELVIALMTEDALVREEDRPQDLLRPSISAFFCGLI